MNKYLIRALIVVVFTIGFTLLLGTQSFFRPQVKQNSPMEVAGEQAGQVALQQNSGQALQQNSGQIAGQQTNLASEAGKNFDELVQVTRVIDGDTIEIEGTKRVRYIGIDTPESVNPEQPVECFALSASNKNKELVEGKMVRLEKDVSETDQYGRLLRYVYQGETFVNNQLVAEGFANVSTFPPDVKYQQIFITSEQVARNDNIGLWGECRTNKDVAGITSCLIKGNISIDNEKIYHLPGQKFYDKTQINESKGERFFCSEEEAVSAGWRKAKL